MALFSDIVFEYIFAGLTALPPGWSVDWVIGVLYGLYRDVMLSLVVVFLTFAE